VLRRVVAVEGSLLLLLAEAANDADPTITTATLVVRSVFAILQYGNILDDGGDTIMPHQMENETMIEKRRAMDSIFAIG
jgi:hypothetical protein